MQAGISFRRRLRRLADEKDRRQPFTESAVLGIHSGPAGALKNRASSEIDDAITGSVRAVADQGCRSECCVPTLITDLSEAVIRMTLSYEKGTKNLSDLSFSVCSLSKIVINCHPERSARGA